jgi:DNA mismatch repair protein MutS2
MAEKWGIPHELIECANAYLGEGDCKVGELLQSLERTQREMEAKRQESERLKREAEIAREKAENLLHRAQKEEESLLSKAREEAQALVRQAKEDLRGLINEFKAQGRTDVHRLGQKIKAEEERISQFALKERPEGLPGDHKEATGQGSQDSGSGGSLGALREIWTLKSGKGKKAMPADRPGLIHYEIHTAVRELKVIGQRVEEALPLVDKALDEAFLAGLKELDIIHGSGTGRLRKAIREYLKEHAFVKSFLPGGPGRGGDGVTVVEIEPAPAADSVKRRSGKERTEQS